MAPDKIFVRWVKIDGRTWCYASTDRVLPSGVFVNSQGKIGNLTLFVGIDTLKILLKRNLPNIQIVIEDVTEKEVEEAAANLLRDNRIAFTFSKRNEAIKRLPHNKIERLKTTLVFTDSEIEELRNLVKYAETYELINFRESRILQHFLTDENVKAMSEYDDKYLLAIAITLTLFRYQFYDLLPYANKLKTKLESA